MGIANELQSYLDRNRLTVELNGVKYEVIDKEKKVICRGVTFQMAVRKAIWLSACPCQESKHNGHAL